MDRETLAALEQAQQGFAYRIKRYIEALLDAHYLKTFQNWIEIERIVTEPFYNLPDTIAPLRSTSTFGRSLYQAEEEVKGFKYDMVMALTAMPNVRWWHRNISRQGFCINGFVKHYPDFIVETGIIWCSRVRTCHELIYPSCLSISPITASESLAVPRYGYVFFLVLEEISYAI